MTLSPSFKKKNDLDNLTLVLAIYHTHTKYFQVDPENFIRCLSKEI